eukprot:TRINITY_DN44016_c0_g1_i1.p1 TRINITY_DN44016_c0_g1~~TRINITY_DN44016_c0_g1_i1.p1  ORF type:complete len:276 (+),score=30.39 TRINITY_DN44016_c0_g1_i1:58-885(+)
MTNPPFVYKGLPPPGILCAAYTCACAVIVWRGRLLGLLFLWPASVYGVITYSYLRDGTFGARALCKRASSDGGIPLLRVIIFLPFLLTCWGIWWLRHALVLLNEDGFNLIAPGIFLGRFPLWFPFRRDGSSGTFPSAGNVAVVDMCAEFPALPWIVKQAAGKYFCMPCLDGDMPEDKHALLKVAKEVAALGPTRPVYVHCANGRGRSCCFAAIVMMLRDDGPKNIDEAVAAIRCQRPQVNIGRAQRALVSSVMRLHATGDVELAHKPILCTTIGE